MVWQVAAGIGMQALGGILGSRSAKRAARERERAYGEASNILTGAYDEAEGFLDQRSEQEQAAISRVNALLGLPGGDGSDPTEVLRNTPGYEWIRSQGIQARERSAAAGGGVVSGNTLAALEEYGQGLADQTFNDYLAQVGLVANQGVDSTLAGMRVNRGNALADLRLGAGGARASGVEGSAAAIAGGLGGAANILSGWGSQRSWQDLLRRQPTKIGMLPGASNSSTYGALPLPGTRLS